MRPGSLAWTMASLPSLLLVSKYTHHIATLPTKAASIASRIGRSQWCVWPSVVPVTRTDSPSATIMNSWQRSARCPPSIVHSSLRDRPSPGSRKPVIGDTYSHSTATAHSASRSGPWAKPPAIQNTAEIDTQPRMRWKLRVSACPAPRRDSTNSVRPTWMAA